MLATPLVLLSVADAAGTMLPRLPAVIFVLLACAVWFTAFYKRFRYFRPF